MTVRGIKAYSIAAELLINELGTNSLESSFAGRYTEEELEDALAAFASVVNRVEKVLLRLNAGTPQHTLAIRRIKAFNIAVELIKRDMSLKQSGGTLTII